MELFKEDQIKQSYRILIAAMSRYAEAATTSTEDAEILINILINVLMNTLQPAYADMFLTELLSTIKDIEVQASLDKQEAFDIIQNSMKGKN